MGCARVMDGPQGMAETCTYLDPTVTTRSPMGTSNRLTAPTRRSRTREVPHR